MLLQALRDAFSSRKETRARLNHLLYASAQLPGELPPTLIINGEPIALCDGGGDGGCYVQIGSYVFVHGAEPNEALANALPLLLPRDTEHGSDSQAA